MNDLLQLAASDAVNQSAVNEESAAAAVDSVSAMKDTDSFQ